MGRRVNRENNRIRRWIFIFSIILILSILSFIVIFYMYNKNINKSVSESIKEYSTIDMLVPNDDVLEIAGSEDKTIEVVLNENIKNENLEIDNNIGEKENKKEEIKVNEIIKKEEKKKVDIEDTKVEVKEETKEVKNESIIEETVSENLSETVQNNINNENNSEIVNNKELKFEIPVSGEIIKDYAEETLVYSKTLDEWGTHLGIDIKAPKTTVVKAAEEGVIEKISKDPRYGNSITINHENGFKTVYSNLLAYDFFEVGEKVLKGENIGTVGDSANFEKADDTHLHFEIYKDGKVLNPTLYLK